MANEVVDQAEEASASGLSAFVAKVLDQLSLTAWLPATVFAASVTMFAEFRAQRGLSVGQAIKAITDNPVPILILVLPVLVLTTMLTQAFSYGAIRTLEGYWRRPWLNGWLRTEMIKFQSWRLRRLTQKRKDAARDAFGRVRVDLLATLPSTIVNALEVKAVGGREVKLDEAEEEKYGHLKWDTECSAWDLARVAQRDRQLADFPENANRVLPTRLGNVLRAAEDRLENTEGKLETFVLRNRYRIPSRLQTQHDQFRDRLDTYCTLAFVAIPSAALAAAMLSGRIAVWQTLVFVGGYSAFGIVCYHSAIASARGYGTALQAIDDELGLKPSIASQ